MGSHNEARIGSIIAAAGIIWTVKIVTASPNWLASFSAAVLPSGPLEICAIGILVWLHAKWRGSVKVQ